jgi:hypothetical protein
MRNAHPTFGKVYTILRPPGGQHLRQKPIPYASPTELDGFARVEFETDCVSRSGRKRLEHGLDADGVCVFCDRFVV